MAIRIRPSIALAAILCTLLSANTRADEGNASTQAASPNPFALKAVDPDALSRQRGGFDNASLGDPKLIGTVANNSASNLNTGSNIITDGALAGASGVPMVIQNSGNNVLIQSATIINVTVK